LSGLNLGRYRRDMFTVATAWMPFLFKSSISGTLQKKLSKYNR
jgi:hypothetical protein